MTGAVVGTGLLVTAALSSLVGAVAALLSARHGAAPGPWQAARWCALVAWAGALAAVLLMEHALVAGRTDLAYAAGMADPTLPLYYRVTSLWAALEGSLLLWLLAFASTLLLLLHRPAGLGRAAHRLAVAVGLGLVGCFAVVALAAVPFAAADGQEVGAGPNPLLQDHPAMGIHPPVLYAGFALLAVPFALSVGALATRSLDLAWARVVRPWVLASWVLLTAGVALGAWWSYAVLGWGGYWAWDPVENASALPWLLATALLHTVARPARGLAWRAWAAVLAGAAFLMVVLATFLTRSGVVQSVHAFSESTLGPVLGGVLVVVTVPWLALLAARRDHLVPDTGRAAALSRQTALRANGVLLAVVTGLVLLGTVLPSLLLAFTGDVVSVGAPWYGRTVGPPALALLVVMAVGPELAWHRDDVRSLARRAAAPGLVGLVVVGVVGLVGPPDPLLALCSGLAAFVVTSFVVRIVARNGGTRPRARRRSLGALLAHAGVALAAVAVVGGSSGSAAQATLPIGGSVSVGATSATLVGVQPEDLGRLDAASARLVLVEGTVPLGEVQPQLRWYPEHATMVAGPAVHTDLLRDVYVTLLDVDPVDGTATVRLAVNPLVPWLWAAVAVAVAGTLLAGWPARRRGRPDAADEVPHARVDPVAVDPVAVDPAEDPAGKPVGEPVP